MQGFFLGLSSGAACVFYCGPALLPYLLGEGNSVRHLAILLIKFLLGRLVGYLIFACIAWLTGLSLQGFPLISELSQGVAYIIMAAMLFFYGSKAHAPSCILTKLPVSTLTDYPRLMPWLLGLLTGLNLCPPFLLLFVDAAVSKNLAEIIWHFFTFFLGTALYFLPMPLLGAAKISELQIIGKLAAVLMSVYYFYSGIIIFLKGVSLF